MAKYRNPNYGCPICGADWDSGHRCSQASLNAIDAANTRALNREFEPDDDCELWRGEGYRIDEGFALMDGEYSEFGDDE